MQTLLLLLPRAPVFYSLPKLAENMSKSDPSTTVLKGLFLHSLIKVLSLAAKAQSPQGKPC